MTTTTERTLVNYTVTDGVAVIELTNLPANTYSYDMMRQLDEAILQGRFDDNVHVLVIRGSGEKFFCAGADINMLNTVTPGFKYYFCLHANETLLRLEQTPKLVIAALNGHTVGGGLLCGSGPRRLGAVDKPWPRDLLFVLDHGRVEGCRRVLPALIESVKFVHLHESVRGHDL